MRREKKPGWVTRLERHPLLLSAGAALIALAAAAGMTWAAGPQSVREHLEAAAPAWLGLAIGARLLSYVGYAIAHRRVMTPERGELETETAARVVAFGAGATSLRGGFSIDARALRGAGASRRRANAHVTALALLEYAVLACLAWGCSLALLGDPHVQGATVWPWAIGVPAGVVAAALGYRRLRRAAHRRGAGSRLRGIVGGTEILACELRRPVAALGAVGGMLLYWLSEAGTLWACLRTFHVTSPPTVAMLGLATGYVLTPRGLPLGGAGIAEVLVPLSLMWLGVPLAAAVPAALAAGLVRLAVSVPLALLAREEVHRLVGLDEQGEAGAHTRARKRRRVVHTSSFHTGGRRHLHSPPRPEINH